jgi:hypothetical protein
MKRSRLTTRWSQRRLRLEFMNGLSYTTIIEFAEPLARRRGSAFCVTLNALGKAARALGRKVKIGLLPA